MLRGNGLLTFQLFPLARLPSDYLLVEIQVGGVMSLLREGLSLLCGFNVVLNVPAPLAVDTDLMREYLSLKMYICICMYYIRLRTNKMYKIEDVCIKITGFESH